MQKLTNGLLKEIYDKSLAHFVGGIDPAVHVQAYMGTHAGRGFAESEFAGKYMSICADFYKQTGNLDVLQNAKQVADSVLANQRADGYIGGYKTGHEWECFSVWNQAFTMLGLLSVWEATGVEDYFAAAERCAWYIIDHFLHTDDDILNAQNYGAQHLAVLIPMAKLYSVTKKTIYRDFFENVFDSMKASDNNFVAHDGIFSLQSKKAIENLCCLIGMELYADQTENGQVQDAVKRYWRELAETQIRETGNGSIKELWCENGNTPALLSVDQNPNETCVSVGWMELSAVLFQREKKAVYLDQIERSLYNHLLGSLDRECTDFAYYQPNFGKRITRTEESMYKCCRYRGYSAIAAIPSHLFCEDGEAVIPMLYTNAIFENSSLRIQMQTEYPFESKVRFQLKGKGRLKLRIPAWCGKYTLTQNGDVIKLPCRDGFVELSGEWDEAALVLELHTAAEYKHVEIDGVRYTGIQYGSVVCVLNCQTEGEIFKAEIDTTGPIVAAEEGSGLLNFQAVGFVDGEARTLAISDYASAGKNADAEYTVWIRERV